VQFTKNPVHPFEREAPERVWWSVFSTARRYVEREVKIWCNPILPIMALNQIDNSGDATLRLAQLFFVEYAAA
jgi:hypothetical protein